MNHWNIAEALLIWPPPAEVAYFKYSSVVNTEILKLSHLLEDGLFSWKKFIFELIELLLGKRIIWQNSLFAKLINSKK